MDLFLQTGDSQFIFIDKFISVFEGVDLHGGETVVGEFQQLYFSGGFVKSNLVEELLKGIGGGLSVLDPLVFEGLVGVLELRDSSSVPIELLLESGDFEIGELKLGIEVLDFFLIVSDGL